MIINVNTHNSGISILKHMCILYNNILEIVSCLQNITFFLKDAGRP